MGSDSSKPFPRAHMTDGDAAQALGFGSGGISRGSTAADYMRTGRGTTPSVVSQMQSMGAKNSSGGSSYSGDDRAAVNAFGFKSGGISRGSTAAGFMRSGEGTTPGVVSQMQSTGAGGNKSGRS
ncbi:hypothetical protein L596_030009 [Steinernema carpocapsae]|uniref:Uncharacterized protein n=1 Tax=Steinernema carpocapsae TaxID=34508 RepID=A0A4U5LRG6_STECR|nr:hypothetical protein L596_030009 [Steinernema carpocapsae]